MVQNDEDGPGLHVAGLVRDGHMVAVEPVMKTYVVEDIRYGVYDTVQAENEEKAIVLFMSRNGEPDSPEDLLVEEATA